MSNTNESRLDGFFQILSQELSSVKQDNPAVQRLTARMRKRAEYIKPELPSKALSSFVELNDLVGKTQIVLQPRVINDAKYFIETILFRFNSRLSELNIQETLDESYLFSLWRFGPGASNGVKGTHVAEKIRQNMTCTSSCEPLVSHLRYTNPYFRCFDTLNGGGVTLVKGSRLTTVPKNEDTVRVIAIEPSGNMALQLAAGQYLTDVLRSIGLDITSQQPKNKKLAERGSLDGDLCTIDLKSASDMFKPELIQLLFPAKWFALLMSIRSEYTEVEKVDVKLNMISTMGNGFTFPLMTLCIVSLIYAFRAGRGGPNLFIDWEKTAVFGDDVIMSSSEYDGFTSLLSDAGLIVNHDKSFSSGPFRESCGGDYWLGRDITPFYARSLAYDHDVFVVINQVLNWCGREKIMLLDTLMYLKNLLRRVHFVPEWSNPDQGVLTVSVSNRYTFLQVERVTRVIFDNDHFLVPLACGGYIESDGPNALYAPRQFKTRYRVRRGRLPKGFLSGRFPEYRDTSVSDFIDQLVWFCFRL